MDDGKHSYQFWWFTGISIVLSCLLLVNLILTYFVLQPEGVNTQDSILDKAAATATNTTTTNNKQGEDIMSVLLAHEKKGGANSTTSIKAALPQESSDSSDNEEDTEMQAVDTGKKKFIKKFRFFGFVWTSKECKMKDFKSDKKKACRIFRWLLINLYFLEFYYCQIDLQAK